LAKSENQAGHPSLRKIFKVEYLNLSIIQHLKAIIDVYRWLTGNLRLWSVISNCGSFGKTGHGEAGIFSMWIFVHVLSSRDFR